MRWTTAGQSDDAVTYTAVARLRDLGVVQRLLATSINCRVGLRLGLVGAAERRIV